MNRFSTALAGIAALAAVGLGAERASALTLEQALQILGEQVLRPSDSLDPISAYMNPAPLAAGIVEPEMGAPPSIDIAAISGNPQWFALVDLQPCAMWEHDAVYVFIDDVTGVVTQIPATDWPLINGVALGDNTGPVTNLIRVFPMVPRPEPARAVFGRAPRGDYGDAPDGQKTYGGAVLGLFPTKFDSTSGERGAVALVTGLETLGVIVSRERDATDPIDPDGPANLVDADRDERMFLAWDPNNSPPTAWIIYDVAVDAGAINVDRYVNVVIDFDQDGMWGTTMAGNEWPVVNQVVSVAPGTKRTLITPAFDWADGLSLPTVAWTRVVLSRNRIDPALWPNGWDGSGVFRWGEVEDTRVFLRECVGDNLVPPPPGTPDDGGGGGDDDDDDDDDDTERGWNGLPINTFAIVVQGKDHPGQTFVAGTAHRMENFLNSQGAMTTRLSGAQSSVSGFRTAVANIAAQVTCQDRVMIYFICHGSNRVSPGGRMRLGRGAGPVSEIELRRADMLSILGQIPPCDGLVCDTPMSSCNVTVMMESCFSGQWLKVFPPTPQDPNPLPPISGPGRTIITTSGEDHSSWATGSDGVYSKRWKDCMRDIANDANGDGRVSPTEAADCVQPNGSGSLLGGTPADQRPEHTDDKCGCTCPPPDECSSARPWAGFGLFSFDLSLATANPDDGQVTPECLSRGTTGFDHDIWLCWTSPIDGPVIMQVLPAFAEQFLDSKMAVFQSCNWPPDPSSVIVCNDDFGDGVLSRVEFDAVAGGQYMIQLGTYPGTPGGMGHVRIDTRPANDECANARRISGLGLFSFNTTFSTQGTAGQDNPACDSFGTTGINFDNWYLWTAPFDGEFFVDTRELTLVDTKVAVYAGGDCPPPPDTLVGCNDDTLGTTNALQSYVPFSAAAGEQFLIQLGTYPFASGGGRGQFNIDVVQPPCEVAVPPDVTLVEGEPCGTSLNNGCAPDGTLMVQPAGPEDVIAGTLFSLFSTETPEDIDVYDVLIPDSGHMFATVESQIEVQTQIVQLDLCSEPPIPIASLVVEPCEPDVLAAPVEPGSYKLIIRPTQQGQPGCPDSETPYSVRLNVEGADQPGACCLSTGECVQMTPTDCFYAGGVFAGSGVTCADAGCHTTPVCPCETTGDSPPSVDVFDLLGYLSMWFPQNGMSGTGLSADYDGSGNVDVFDLLDYLSCWFSASAGMPCP